MKIIIFLLLMICHGTYANDLSIKGILTHPTKANNDRLKSSLGDLPLHIIQEFVFPYLSEHESDILIESQYGDLKSILKLWPPRRRLQLLQRALKRINADPAFDDNYLLRYSAAKGLKDVVELLLKYQSVDPKALGNWALILAAENNHGEVLETLSRHIGLDPEIVDHGSSYSILMDLVGTVHDEPWKQAQQRRDLQLLLDTSTKILPFLKDGILMAILNNRTDLAKIMLFFVAFDYSSFNHLVLIRQLAAGNSLFDLRKIDPFNVYENSLFLHAIGNQNVELAHFMLDNGVKWIHLSLLMISRTRSLYIQAFEHLSDQIEIQSELSNDLQLHQLRMRIQSILHFQIIFEISYLFLGFHFLIYSLLMKIVHGSLSLRFLVFFTV